MNILAIIANFKFQDLLDILFLTVVAYHLFIWFQGTKAFKALIGLLILGAVFTIARAGGLFLTTWVFQFLWQILVILLVVLFQSEIRQVLEKVNPLQRFGFRRRKKSEEWIVEFAKGVFALAGKKTGALIIIERAERVREYMTEGQKLESAPTPEVLKSIFQKESPFMTAPFSSDREKSRNGLLSSPHPGRRTAKGVGNPPPRGHRPFRTL